MSELKRAAAIGAAAAVITPLLAATPVAAQAPAGCKTWAHANDWEHNCYLGAGQSPSQSKMLQGAQHVLQGNLMYTQSKSGIWNSYADARVREYQTSRGLTSDAVLGSATWKKMHADLHLQDCNGSACYYTAGFDSNWRFFRETTSDYWSSSSNSGVWNNMNLTSPGPA